MREKGREADERVERDKERRKNGGEEGQKKFKVNEGGREMDHHEGEVNCKGIGPSFTNVIP